MLALRNGTVPLYAANLNRVLGVSTARYALLLNTDMYFDPQAAVSFAHGRVHGPPA